MFYDLISEPKLMVFVNIGVTIFFQNVMKFCSVLIASVLWSCEMHRKCVVFILVMDMNTSYY